MGAPGTAEAMEIHASAPRPLARAALAVAVVALPGCTDDARVGTGGHGQRGPGDSLTGQGVEIVRDRVVPELVAVGPVQAVTFVNRDDISHHSQGERSRERLPLTSVRSCAAGLPGALPCTARSSRAALEWVEAATYAF
jgi:hypothetical protein